MLFWLDRWALAENLCFGPGLRVRPGIRCCCRTGRRGLPLRDCPVWQVAHAVCLPGCPCLCALLPSCGLLADHRHAWHGGIPGPAPVQVRHQERQSAHGSPAQLALLALGGSKRRKQSPKVTAPAGRSPPAALRPAPEASAAAAAAEEEPDPRVCLWEPPASPYGLLGEGRLPCLLCGCRHVLAACIVQPLQGPPAAVLERCWTALAACHVLCWCRYRPALWTTPAGTLQRKSSLTIRGSCSWPACC